MIEPIADWDPLLSRKLVKQAMLVPACVCRLSLLHVAGGGGNLLAA